MALAKFKMKVFQYPTELEKYVQTAVDVASVVAIVYDAASGKHVLYYLTP